MFVKMLHTAAGPKFCYTAGHVVEVDDELGKAWIDGRFAEKAAAPPVAAAAPAAAEETAAVEEGEIAASTDSPFKKLTGKGKGDSGRGGNPPAGKN